MASSTLRKINSTHAETHLWCLRSNWGTLTLSRCSVICTRAPNWGRWLSWWTPRKSQLEWSTVKFWRFLSVQIRKSNNSSLRRTKVPYFRCWSEYRISKSIWVWLATLIGFQCSVAWPPVTHIRYTSKARISGWTWPCWACRNSISSKATFL